MSRASTPGSFLPSISSSDAPPPVERCSPVGEPDLRDRRDAVAAADDREASHSAIALATPRVPAANGAGSNRPIGPFQNTVPASAMSRHAGGRAVRRDVLSLMPPARATSMPARSCG